MIGTDLQLERIQVILATDRPQPEPDEAEVRRVLEHLGTSPEAQEPGAETAEVRR
jgi:hypothetical protein